jgi:hypothetical protein
MCDCYLVPIVNFKQLKLFWYVCQTIRLTGGVDGQMDNKRMEGRTGQTDGQTPPEFQSVPVIEKCTSYFNLLISTVPTKCLS